jgi:hypothetical protein
MIFSLTIASQGETSTAGTLSTILYSVAVRQSSTNRSKLNIARSLPLRLVTS